MRANLTLGFSQSRCCSSVSVAYLVKQNSCLFVCLFVCKLFSQSSGQLFEEQNEFILMSKNWTLEFPFQNYVTAANGKQDDKTENKKIGERKPL
jgi:hypothetical protein